MTAQQLKNSILQMAVQGMLVPQDPNDEPASVLLERIRAEKEQMVKDGKIKKEKNPSIIFRGEDNLPYEKVGDNEPVCIADEVPFEIPDTWAWARLGTISNYAGKKEKIKAKEADKDLWELDLEDIEKGGRILSQKTVGECNSTGDKTVFHMGEILYSKLRPYLLKVLVAPEDGICTSELVPFSVYGDIFAEFIVLYLKSPAVDFYINSITYGIKMPRVGTETMVNLFVPIPPILEQQRIVEKYENLLPLVDDYGATYDTLEKCNSGFPDQLKKSILQQAVQGKLVPQDPADEPASVLLERIRAEKEQMIKDGKIKRDKHESIIYRKDDSFYEKIDGVERCIDDEIPFEIPESWEWVRWGTLSESIQYGYIAQAKNSGVIKMVRISDIQNGEILWDSVPFCDIPKQEINNYLLKKNDILFARTGGTVGKSYLVENIPEEAIYAGYLIRTRFGQYLCPHYLKYFMESNLYWFQLKAGTIATAQPNCNAKTLAKMILPLPPLSEQYHIVDKVKKIMSAIDLLLTS